MPHGGKRAGAGRRKDESAKLPDVVVSKGFCLGVFARIGEGKPKEIKSPEDYMLNLLYSGDIQTESYNFNKCLDRIYGKPAQGTFQGDTREESKEVTFGDLPMPAGARPGETGKPN